MLKENFDRINHGPAERCVGDADGVPPPRYFASGDYTAEVSEFSLTREVREASVELWKKKSTPT